MEGHPDHYTRGFLEAGIKNPLDGTLSSQAMKCQSYFLQNFRPDVLALDHLTSYRSDDPLWPIVGREYRVAADIYKKDVVYGSKL